MKCISAINPVPNQHGRDRMDLHCYNRGDPRQPNRCRARCHMGVITEDPKEWVCHEYSFAFQYNNMHYTLVAYDKIVDPRHQHRDPEESKTALYSNNTLYTELIKVNFIPISTGDDMHIEATKLFHRLRNLVIFT